jgi:glutaminyl-peptide cyclotransferase
MTCSNRILPITIAAALLIAAAGTGAQRRETPVAGYQLVRSFPHDPEAFTQGLVFVDGVLYESTGLNGKSSIRKVKVETGEVLQIQPLEARYFGEGIAVVGDRVVQLTWQSGVGFVYDRATFKRQRSFTYEGEGWGIAYDGSRLIMSDGTASLRFLDPQTLKETGRLQVRDKGAPVAQLNELEIVKGEIFANVWQTHRIVRISPKTGEVLGWIDMRNLLTPAEAARVDVMNGIAYDAKNDRLFVTGKYWPKLFEVKVK